MGYSGAWESLGPPAPIQPVQKGFSVSDSDRPSDNGTLKYNPVDLTSDFSKNTTVFQVKDDNVSPLRVNHLQGCDTP